MAEEPILIVEDDPDINALLAKIAAREGFRTVSAYSGTEALLQVERASFALVLLDMMLPGLDGPGFVEQVRAQGLRVPVIVVSAKASAADKVDMLKLGADDYVTKPFDPDEVAARIHAVLRRVRTADSPQGDDALGGTAGQGGAAGWAGRPGTPPDGTARPRAAARGAAGSGAAPDAPDEAYEHRGLRLDVARRRVTFEGADVVLTAHEFDILHVLMQAPDKVFSRERLYELVWKSGYYGEENAVNVHVSNLRKKLVAAGAQGEYIKTVWGIGFKLT